MTIPQQLIWFFGLLFVGCQKSPAPNIPTPTPPTSTALTDIVGTGSVTVAGQFRVDGARILDPAGADFIPVGANIGLWKERATPTPDDVRLMKQVWKFNTVRVPVYISRRQYYEHLFPTNDYIEQYVKAFTDTTYGHRCVVLFECHDFSGGFYTADSNPSLTNLSTFWAQMATRYKANPYVWFNVMNEPGYQENPVPTQWFTTHETAIKAIRQTGNQHIIVCDGHSFALERLSATEGDVPEARSAILTYGPQLASTYKNIVFSYHVYCPWNNSQPQMTAYLDRVKAENLTILAGEYGVRGGDNCDALPAATYLTGLLQQRGIGRLVWHYTGWDGNNLVNGSGTTGSDLSDKTGSKPPVGPEKGQLTPLGSLVWDDTH